MLNGRQLVLPEMHLIDLLYPNKLSPLASPSVAENVHLRVQ